MKAFIKSFNATALLLLVLGLFAQSLPAQEVFQGKETAGRAEDRVRLNKGFQKYTLFELDHKALYELIDANRKGTFFRLQVAGFDWSIALYENDMRAPGYAAGQTGDDGYKEVALGECVTFAGYLAESGKDVRLNLEPNRVWGFVTTEEGQYFIEPLNRFIADAKEGAYILYNADDVVISGEASCGADTQSEKVKKAHATHGAPKTGDDCRKLEIAAESDFEAFNTGISFNDILANLNMVESIYLNTFGMDIIVVYQHQWTTPADPYTTTESGCASFGVLQQFGAEWFMNFTHIRRDMTALYSGKDFNGSTIGCAWIGVFGDGGNNNGVLQTNLSIAGPYSVNQWDWQAGLTSDASRTTLVAHEIGHNFGGEHDSNGGCANIMCPGIVISTIFNATAQTAMNGTMNFESVVANDGRSALRERYVSATEGGLAIALMPSTTAANVLFVDATLIAIPLFSGNTAQYNATEEIRFNPGAFMEAAPDFNYRFDIAGCAGSSLVQNVEDGPDLASGDQFLGLIAGKSDSDVVLYPNPTRANSFIRIESSEEAQVFIRVFDGLGRTVVESVQQLVEGVNLIEIQSGGLNQGLYFVNLRMNGEDSRTLKLQKIE